LNYGFKILGTLAELLGGSVGDCRSASPFARRVRKEPRGSTPDPSRYNGAEPPASLAHSGFLPDAQSQYHPPGLSAAAIHPWATDLMAMIFYYYSFSLFLSLSSAFSTPTSSRGGIGLVLPALTSSLQPGPGVRPLLCRRAAFWARRNPHWVPHGRHDSVGMPSVRNLGGLAHRWIRRWPLCREGYRRGPGGGTDGLGAASLDDMPLTTSQDFIYLCIICGVGSLMYLCVLGCCTLFL